MDGQDPGEKSIQPPEPIGRYKDSVLEHSLQGWGSCLGRGAEDSLKLWLHQTCPPRAVRKGRESGYSRPGGQAHPGTHAPAPFQLADLLNELCPSHSEWGFLMGRALSTSF